VLKITVPEFIISFPGKNLIEFGLGVISRVIEMNLCAKKKKLNIL
jgi:hypothetical protein